MSNLCFICMACGRQNPHKGSSYTNKYCNNKCQQDHQRRQLVYKKIEEWKNKTSSYKWKDVPEYIKTYLIENRGYQCEVCKETKWNSKDIPLLVSHINGDIYDNQENNLILICYNCEAQR